MLEVNLVDDVGFPFSVDFHEAHNFDAAETLRLHLRDCQRALAVTAFPATTTRCAIGSSPVDCPSRFSAPRAFPLRSGLLDAAFPTFVRRRWRRQKAGPQRGGDDANGDGT